MIADVPLHHTYELQNSEKCKWGIEPDVLLELNVRNETVSGGGGGAQRLFDAHLGGSRHV